jgi:hypothetical protein
VTEKSIVLIGIASAALSAVYVLAGLVRLRTDRITAYNKFYRANLVALLITQPFAFYVATFIPVLALGINLAALFTLQYLLEHERKLGVKAKRRLR